MKPLQEALAGWKPTDSGRKIDPLVALAARWAKIVGETVARGSHPSAIEGTTLVVIARSSAWVAQLGYLEAQILAELRIADPTSAVKRIRPIVGQMRAKPSPRFVPAQPSRPTRKPVSKISTGDPFKEFRASVEDERRAKREAGWKECQGCGAMLPGEAPMRCVTCQNAQQARREREISRLQYEMPWLGFLGTAEYIDGLSELEYRAIRRRLLSRWRQALNLALKRGVLSRDGRERRIASSYLVLKSGLHPDRIAEATIRAEFGDDLYTLLYATNG